MDLDLTDLTAHPDWPRFAKLMQLLENQFVGKLKDGIDPDANMFLIALSRLKAEIRARSRNPNLWKV